MSSLLYLIPSLPPSLSHSRYHKRNIWTTPKRSTHIHRQLAGPSPIAEQRTTTSSSHQQQQQQQQRSGGDILVVYHLDDVQTPYAKRVSSGPVTLADFKEKVFSRMGEYR